MNSPSKLTIDMFPIDFANPRNCQDSFDDSYEEKIALCYEILRRNPTILNRKYLGEYQKGFCEHSSWNSEIHSDTTYCTQPDSSWQLWIRQAFPSIQYSWMQLKEIPCNSDVDDTSVRDQLLNLASNRWLKLPTGVAHDHRIISYKKGQKNFTVSKDKLFFDLSTDREMVYDKEQIRKIENQGYRIFALKYDLKEDLDAALDEIKSKKKQEIKDNPKKKEGYPYKGGNYFSKIDKWNAKLVELEYSEINKQLDSLMNFWNDNDYDKTCIPLTTD